MTSQNDEYEQKSHCPACGKAGVVMSLNYVLLEQERHYGQLEGVMRAKGPWMPAATKRD
jgi:hypothetical protein